MKVGRLRTLQVSDRHLVSFSQRREHEMGVVRPDLDISYSFCFISVLLCHHA